MTVRPYIKIENIEQNFYNLFIKYYQAIFKIIVQFRLKFIL